MECNCRNIYVSTVETTDTEIVLVPNREIKNVVNAETYGLVLCNGAAAAANLPVFIKTDLGNIPVLCKAGNTMYANQLNTRVRYPIIYGNGNENYKDGQFVVLSCVNPRSAIAATGSI